jgi:hypothetical protein
MEGCRLWVSDGTDAGTAPVADREIIHSAWDALTPPRAIRYLAVNGSVLVPGERDYAGNTMAFRTDGTEGSFEPLADPLLQGLFPDGRWEWPRLRGQMFVPGPGSVVRTDGTAEGSAIAFPGTMGRASGAYAGRWYFWRNNGELWTSDGTDGEPSSSRTGCGAGCRRMPGC